MARKMEGGLFIGRLSKSTRTTDLEEVFEPYGRLLRCDVKYGAEMAYGFVDFEDRRDAEDAMRYENGRNISGSSILIEWAKGAPRTGPPQFTEKCYNCNRVGHMARDCRGGGGGGRPFRGSFRGSYRGSYRGSDRDYGPSRYRERSRSRSRSRSHDRRRRPSSITRSRTPLNF